MEKMDGCGGRGMDPVCINSNEGYRYKDHQVFETFLLLENQNNHEECLMFLNGLAVLLRPLQLSSTPQLVVFAEVFETTFQIYFAHLLQRADRTFRPVGIFKNLLYL